jgi:ribosomal protein S24E
VNEELKIQIEDNMRSSQQNNKVMKGNIHTHYGPEESEDDIKILFDRKRKQQEEMKHMLSQQMQDKENLRKSLKDA